MRCGLDCSNQRLCYLLVLLVLIEAKAIAAFQFSNTKRADGANLS